MSFEDEVRATFRRGDSAGVLRIAEAEVERARKAGEPAGEVEGLYAMARVSLRGGDLARAEVLARMALDVAVLSGDRRLEERPRHVLAAAARMSGDYAKARELYLASIELNEALGQAETVNSEYHNLAFTELHLGNLDRARELFAAGRERVFREGYRSFVPYLGVAAAALASAEGDPRRAARMIGFTDGAYVAIGQVPDPDDAEELSKARSLAVRALGEAEFDLEYSRGEALEPTEAFGLNEGVKMTKVLIVLTSHDQLGDTGRKTGFWLEELAAPYYRFRDAGWDVTLASPKGGRAPLDPKSNEPNFQTDQTRRFEADAEAESRLDKTVRLDSVSADDFDTVFYPGGHGPLWDLAEDENSIRLIERISLAGKPIALVCHAPGGLRHVKAPDGTPLVAGRRVTGFTNGEEEFMGLTEVVPFLVEDELIAKGADYSKVGDFEPYVVTDGLLITGQNPASSGPAAAELISLVGRTGSHR